MVTYVSQYSYVCFKLGLYDINIFDTTEMLQFLYSVSFFYLG